MPDFPFLSPPRSAPPIPLPSSIGSFIPTSALTTMDGVVSADVRNELMQILANLVLGDNQVRAQ
jgi:hypothetical protein